MEIVSGFREEIEASRKTLGKKALFAYGTNLDSVVEIGLPEANSVSRYLPGLLECMKNGGGKEIRMGESEFRKVVGLLPPGSPRVGGQAGNMALDAAKLGVKSYMHTPSKSRELLSLFRSGNVLVATESGFAPAGKAFDDSEPPVHLILEFKKGPGIPSSNRFIASYENLNPSLSVDPLFSREITKEIPKISRAFIAGFHLLSPEVFEKRIEYVKNQISSWKKLNPKLKLHLEWGSFLSEETEVLCSKHVLPMVDCVGFNEDEMTLGRDKFPQKFGRIGNSNFQYNEKTEALLEKTKTAVLHMRDCSLAFSKEFSSKSLARSLSFASAVAGFKASRGRAPTFAELERTRFRAKKINPPGIDERMLKRNDIPFAFSPSAEIIPKFTVGLGDCFSMAFFLSLK